jgi:two-component system, NarL family, nitrate/nitrite response regulator NarL
MVRVMIGDDEPGLRDAWSGLIGRQPDMEFVGALPSADHLSDEIAKAKPDVVLLDLVMPGMDAVDALALLASHYPAVRVIVYAAWPDNAVIRRVFEAGAAGYVDKLMDPRQLVDAIRRAAGGEVISPVHW